MKLIREVFTMDERRVAESRVYAQMAWNAFSTVANGLQASMYREPPLHPFRIQSHLRALYTGGGIQ
jgi:hypothetical protein